MAIPPIPSYLCDSCGRRQERVLHGNTGEEVVCMDCVVATVLDRVTPRRITLSMNADEVARALLNYRDRQGNPPPSEVPSEVHQPPHP